ncbi:MAG TPA: hypothetical protein VMT90_05200 [Dehalococcoidia bacterium]|nr:hypothetical protein [Dehalococcoidia bacterium]
MKKYRVMYRPTDRAGDLSAKTEEVYADGWRVDQESVVLFTHTAERDDAVFDVPKSRVMRIQEIGAG